jgi:hypothetical protein
VFNHTEPKRWSYTLLYSLSLKTGRQWVKKISKKVEEIISKGDDSLGQKMITECEEAVRNTQEQCPHQ